MKKKKMKGYIYYGGDPQFYIAYLILENGMVCYEHLCSHPNFMPGDLWQGRPERHAEWERIGYELDLDTEPKELPLPDELKKKNQHPDGHKEFAELLFPPEEKS